MGCDNDSCCDESNECTPIVTIPAAQAGTAGQAATVQVGTTTDGAPGSSASVINSGTSSNAVLDFTLAKGQAGTNGNNGTGFTGGSYDAATGIVTFLSSDGLGFSTSDLRGDDGANGANGNALGSAPISVTYSELSTHITNSTLLPGNLYKFPYTTKHLIGETTSAYNHTSTTHDAGTGTLTTFVPETENLLVLAISTNKIHIKAYSESHPRDIIYYDQSLNLTEDGLVSRPGFITYRENPDDNISAPFDFRNVLHRRYDADYSTSASTTLQSSFRTATGFVSTTSNNTGFYHRGDGELRDTVGPFLSNSDGSNATSGFLTAPLTGVFRDFKTFVAYDEPIWDKGGATGEKPRYRNIKILSSDKSATVGGSGADKSIETETPDPAADTNGETGVFGKFYPTLANVVIFTRSAENIEIGAKSTGITITGRSVHEIEIGNCNENITIGGQGSKPIYSSTFALISNEIGNVNIGNNNRNIAICPGGNMTRYIDIGDSNVGIFLTRYSESITLGNGNTNFYSHFCVNINLGDYCKDVFTSTSTNVFVKNGAEKIDVMLSQFGGKPETGSQHGFDDPSPSQYFPQFGNVNTNKFASGQAINPGTGPVIVYSSPTIEGNIGNEDLIAYPTFHAEGTFIEEGCNNILLAQCSNIKLGSFCTNIYMERSEHVVIEGSCYSIDLNFAQFFEVGSHSFSIEVYHGYYVKIGKACKEIKLLQCWYSSIGDFSNRIYLIAMCVDVDIDTSCAKISIKNGQRISIGSRSGNIFIEKSKIIKTGIGCDDIFIRIAENCTIGNECSAIVFNDLNITDKSSTAFEGMGLYNYFISNPQITSQFTAGGADATRGSRREYAVGGGPGAYDGDDVMALSIIAGADQSYIGDNHVGNDSNNINIINSQGNTIGNKCNQIYIGCLDVGNLDTVYTNGVGDFSTRTAATITSNPVYSSTGKDCNYNSIGNLTSSVKLAGIGKIYNEFGSYSSNVVVPAGVTFTHNRVLVNGTSISVSVDCNKQVFQFKDVNDGRWSKTLNINGGEDAATGATATITATSPGSSGTITTLTYGGVSLFDTATPITGTTLNDFATNINAAINAFTSVPNFTSTVSGAVVTITADASSGATVNGQTAVIVTTGGAGFTGTALSGGASASAVKLV